MTQEEKELLLKDLCGRLPYGIIIQEYNEEYGYSDNALNTISIGYFSIHEASIEGTWINRIENVRPYLRPMSSMTKEERIEYNIIKCSICPEDADDYAGFVEWLNEHHFDYRGLIPRGLALEAPEDIYKS